MNLAERLRFGTFQWRAALLLGLLWFLLLGYRDLIDPDEGRYAEIPREMVASGDWVTPRVDGFKYFEKPALQYWTTAVSYELFGQSNATARLWTALIGYLCGLFVWFLGDRLYGGKTGFYAFLVTMSSLLFAAMGHILTLDMTVSAFLVFGVGALVLAQFRREDAGHVRGWMLAGWAMLGLAVLSKGLIGLVLPGGAVLFYSLWQRDWGLWRHLHLVKGLLLLLAVTAPWFVLVSLRNPEFAHFFFIHEHFERYTTTEHHRDGPLLYFVVIYLLGVVPWLVSGVRVLFRPGLSWKRGDGAFDAERFLWVFVAFTLVFFSLGHSKLPAYILPVMPVVGLFIGRRLAEHPRERRWDGYVALAGWAVLLLAAVFITKGSSDVIPPKLLVNYRTWVLGGALAMVLGGMALLRWRGALSMTAASLLFLLAFQLHLWGFQEIAVSRSSRQVADAIRAHGLDSVPVYVVDTYPHSLPFYLGKNVRLVKFAGELSMGIQAEPEKWIPDLKGFASQWKAQSQAVAVFGPDLLPQLNKMGLPMKRIFTGPRYIVVARR